MEGGKRGKVNLFRFKVNMGEADLKNFGRLMGGEVKEYRLAEVVAMLNLAKERDGVSIGKIMAIAKELVASFERNYGEKLFLDAELITRLYVAIRLEVERRREECPVVERRVGVDPFRIQQYLYGGIKSYKSNWRRVWRIEFIRGVWTGTRDNNS